VRSKHPSRGQTGYLNLPSGQMLDMLTVFNIGGNKFRLIVRIRYDYQLVNVRSALTHKEYDEGKWKE